MYKSLFGLAILCSFLGACNSQSNSSMEENTINQPHLPPPSSDKSSMVNEMDMPKEIDGCACYYGKNKTQFEAKRYIFAESYSGKAYITINGKLEVCTLTATEKKEAGLSFKRFENERFILMLQSNPGNKKGDELWESSGNLTVVKKSSGVQIIQLYGECGC